MGLTQHLAGNRSGEKPVLEFLTRVWALGIRKRKRLSLLLTVSGPHGSWSQDHTLVSRLPRVVKVIGETTSSIRATGLRLRRVLKGFGQTFPKEGGRLFELFRESNNQRTPTPDGYGTARVPQRRYRVLE